MLADTWNVLPKDGELFGTRARLKHRTSDVLYEGAMIAATAEVHRLVVVTRNLPNFLGFGVRLFNPFDGSERE